MKKLFLLMVALLTLAGLGGCAVPNQLAGDARVHTRLNYAYVYTNETCGANYHSSFFRRLDSENAGPYRLAYVVFFSTGPNYWSALPTYFSASFVPDGMPELHTGDIVLVRTGDSLKATLTQGVNPNFGGMPVIVKKVLDHSAYPHGPLAWDGGPDNTGLPMVGFKQSPWPIMPWPETVAHYDLHFTPFWKVNADGTCSQLRRFPEHPNPVLLRLPTWPERNMHPYG